MPKYRPKTKKALLNFNQGKTISWLNSGYPKIQFFLVLNSSLNSWEMPKRTTKIMARIIWLKFTTLLLLEVLPIALPP